MHDFQGMRSSLTATSCCRFETLLQEEAGSGEGAPPTLRQLKRVLPSTEAQAQAVAAFCPHA
jgi:hypothetical protein